MIHLSALLQGFGKTGGRQWCDHKFLHVDTGIRVRATVEDIHHRYRQNVGIRAADIAIERQRCRISGSLGHCHGYAQDRIGAQLGFVLGTIQLQHYCIDQALIISYLASQLISNDFVDVFDRLQNALTQVTRSTIAQLMRFVLTSRSTRRYPGAAMGAVV